MTRIGKQIIMFDQLEFYVTVNMQNPTVPVLLSSLRFLWPKLLYELFDKKAYKVFWAFLSVDFKFYDKRL